MKKLIICACLGSCIPGREIQVRSSYATIVDITKLSRVNMEDRILLHMKSENNIPMFMEAPMADTSRYLVGGRYPFLAPR